MLHLDSYRLKEIYRNLVYPRLIEEKMLVLLRQGKISKWFSGIGQEAIAVGATSAMSLDEWIFPLHRNLGVFTTRKLPLNQLFSQWQGSLDGYTNGRERSFHFGSKEHFICGMISHLGPQMALACGVSLAYKFKNKTKCSLVFTGDGGTSEGDFHEALNLAAVWDLPVVFLIENNGYGLSTPTKEQYRCKHLIDKAIGYGMTGVQINGNDIVEVYQTISDCRKHCIEKQKPILVEALTFRIRGHEEASGIKYVPPELIESWLQKDPIINFESYLTQNKILTQNNFAEIKSELKDLIEQELKLSFNSFSNNLTTSVVKEESAIYCPSYSSTTILPADSSKKKLRFIEAISDALKLAFRQNPELIIMGQDIAEYGGAFKVTDKMVNEFGKDRIRNTPICESVVIGAALGLSLENIKSIVEMQFADFVSVGFNQIVNNLAKIYYRWGQNADVVIRLPTGAGVGAGPFHSQSNEAWFFHTPGLKIVYPSNPKDAKGLLLAAINDPNPVLYFEHKALYRSIEGDVPTNYYEVEIGKGEIIKSGNDLTIITYGMGVHWALQYQNENPNVSLHILDLKTLLPLDYQAIIAAVKQTNKVLLLHEDNLTGGIGAEIAAYIVQHAFEFLDAPIRRCASLDTPIPFNNQLEQQYLAKFRLAEEIKIILNY